MVCYGYLIFVIRRRRKFRITRRRRIRWLRNILRLRDLLKLWLHSMRDLLKLWLHSNRLHNNLWRRSSVSFVGVHNNNIWSIILACITTAPAAPIATTADENDAYYWDTYNGS
ncbi:hypothetical protein X975_17090, partial [Stegodyphus mimosarum]